MSNIIHYSLAIGHSNFINLPGLDFVMKVSGLIFTTFLLLMSPGCRETPDCQALYSYLENEFDSGNFAKVRILSDSIKKVCPDNNLLIYKSDSISQIAERIGLDFSFSESRIDSQLTNIIGTYSEEDKETWERKNWLEFKIINGEKYYFRRSVANLDTLMGFYFHRTRRDTLEARDPEFAFRKKHIRKIIEKSDYQCLPVAPTEIIINYNIIVHPDVVPSGEMIRCWLPYPKESHPRQQEVKLLSSSQKDFIIAPDSTKHRTIYMEAIAEKGSQAHFSVSFSYLSSGQYFDKDRIKILPFDKTAKVYKEYTSEQLPHICFSPDVKHLADSIAENEEDPLEIVRKIYSWFSNNIPWTGALEYSTMPNISEYVIKNRRGDCGMQTFLLMSMLRYKGIPIRWQSGWKVTPDAKNLHDWCEVYYEGPGWVPLDISYGLQYSDDRKTKEFYISGIDSYRLIINDGVAGSLSPEKKFLRSEPFDFQRGEVEWDGGNLYFDKWDYEMEIIYNK